jgi:hypothetical protein
MQIEKVVMDISESKLISNENLLFLNTTNLEDLSPRHFLLYKQLVCLTKIFSESQDNCLSEIDFDMIFKKFDEVSPEKRSNLVAEETARFTNP